MYELGKYVYLNMQNPGVNIQIQNDANPLTTVYQGLIDLGNIMTFENLSNINYNIKKILEELRKRITDNPELNEIIDERQIVYQESGKDLCIIKVKKDHLEIDFIGSRILEDPMEFSWKIKPNKKYKFNRRMQIKNISDIETTFILLSQSYAID